MGVAEPTIVEWVDACCRGDRRALGRLISLLESPDSQIAAAASQAVSGLPLPRQSIGITGPPGAGKSTLIDYLVHICRTRGRHVGILAVDPSSPFTGGALLGDRVRMTASGHDPHVFFRSMGSRGARGGVASAAGNALRVLAAGGFETVFIETVGAGQVETDVINLADTICVVQVPGYGDDVQLMKMGILEIADVFAVNKGDKPEAQDLKIELEMALHDSTAETCRALRQLGKTFSASFTGAHWQPPVILVSALRKENGEALLDAFDKHLEFLQDPALSSALKRERVKSEMLMRAKRVFQESLMARLNTGGDLSGVLDECADGSLSIEEAIEKVFKHGV